MTIPALFRKNRNRFHCIPNSIFGQPEVGTNLIRGGGASQGLPLLVEWSRALDIIPEANDCDAVNAEKYGWINRAVPVEELGALSRP